MCIPSLSRVRRRWAGLRSSAGGNMPAARSSRAMSPQSLRLRLAFIALVLLPMCSGVLAGAGGGVQGTTYHAVNFVAHMTHPYDAQLFSDNNLVGDLETLFVDNYGANYTVVNSVEDDPENPGYFTRTNITAAFASVGVHACPSVAALALF